MIEHFLKVIAKSKILGQMDHPNDPTHNLLGSFKAQIQLKNKLSH